MASSNKNVLSLPLSIDSWSKTKHKDNPDEKFTFAWTIENFRSRPEKTGESISSATFIMKHQDNVDLKWKLKAYPKGISSPYFMSIFMEYESNAPVKECLHDIIQINTFILY